MYKLVFLYRRVDDEQALEDFFAGIHLPHAERLPDLLGSEVCRIAGKPDGPSRFHMTYALYFASQENITEALRSPAGIQLLQAIHSWIEAGVISWFYGHALADKHTSQKILT